MKICLSCSTGGHLDELSSIFGALEEYDIFLITARSETTSKLSNRVKTYFINNEPKAIKSNDHNIYRNLYILSLVVHNIFLIPSCLRVLLKEKPNVIIGCGAEATLVVSYIGKLMGSKIVYLETLTRVNDISLTGKLCYHISDVFLVQWEGLLDKYRRAKYWGKVL